MSRSITCKFMGAGIGASNMRCMFNELGSGLSSYLNFCLNKVYSQRAQRPLLSVLLASCGSSITPRYSLQPTTTISLSRSTGDNHLFQVKNPDHLDPINLYVKLYAIDAPCARTRVPVSSAEAFGTISIPILCTMLLTTLCRCSG